MERVRVYDKLTWHEDGDNTAGIFFGWAAKRGLLSDDVAPRDTSRARAGKLSGRELLESYGGSLASDLLSDEGNGFARAMFESKSSPVPKTNRALDAAFSTWRAQSSSSKGGPSAKSKTATRKTSPDAPSAEVEGRLARLRARAKKKHAVEVEHLLPFAELGDASAAAPLRELAAKHKWPHGGRGIVPLGAWVDVIAAYLESGLEPMVRKAKTKVLRADLVLSILEELDPSLPGAHAAVEVARWAERQGDASLVGEAMDTLSWHLADDVVAADGALSKSARLLAHRYLGKTTNPLVMIRSYKVLGAVGDERSLKVILARPPLTKEWKGCEKGPIARLRKRLEGPRSRRQ